MIFKTNIDEIETTCHKRSQSTSLPLAPSPSSADPDQPMIMIMVVVLVLMAVVVMMMNVESSLVRYPRAMLIAQWAFKTKKSSDPKHKQIEHPWPKQL